MMRSWTIQNQNKSNIELGHSFKNLLDSKKSSTLLKKMDTYNGGAIHGRTVKHQITIDEKTPSDRVSPFAPLGLKNKRMATIEDFKPEVIYKSNVNYQRTATPDIEIKFKKCILQSPNPAMTPSRQISFGHDSFISFNESNFSDEYTVLSCIGKGGYGMVYKVISKKSGLMRAMKSTKILVNISSHQQEEVKKGSQRNFVEGISHAQKYGPPQHSKNLRVVPRQPELLPHHRVNKSFCRTSTNPLLDYAMEEIS